MIETLNVQRREETGKHRIRRMRRNGLIPAVLYGHKQDSVSLTLKADQINAAIRHGTKLVDLSGDLKESALIREVQWDTFGMEVLHVDFTRVDKDERVEVTVPVELKGEAAGAGAGGVVNHQLHEVEIECAAVAIPDHITVNINSLQVDQNITAGELTLPEGAKLITPEDAVVVSCDVPTEVPEEELAAGEGAEPEVIGRKEEEVEEGD